MLHGFQESLILAQSSIPTRDNTNSDADKDNEALTALRSNAAVNLGLITARMSAIVDLDSDSDAAKGDGFREPFYVLVAEKTVAGVMLHMWRLTVTSKVREQGGRTLKTKFWH